MASQLIVFLSVKYRAAIVESIRKQSDREAYAVLLSYINKMLSVTQQSDQSKIAIPDIVQKLELVLVLYHKTAFPFAMITPSIHQMCAHSWELFAMIDGKPITIYGEQGQEAWNKHIRSYKSGSAARARQSSIKVNIQGIFQRMNIQTHPKIALQKRQIVCT